MKSYLKGLKKFCFDKVNLTLILTVVVLIVGFGFFYVFVVSRAQSSFINQMYHKEELAVSSGASSIKIFLDMVENSLLLLSRNPSVINQDTEIQNVLDKFALDWAGTPVLGAARFDKDGQLRFIGNNVGASSEVIEKFIRVKRDYFVWAQTSTVEDTYLGKPLFPSIETPRAEYIFPFVTPIQKNGEFDGILVLAISLSRLTETYLDPMKVSPNCRVYLFHPDGTILAGVDELIGLNYFEYLDENPYPGSEEALQGLKEAVESRDKGRLDIFLYSPLENGVVRFIIAYTSIIYNDEHWIYGLAIPISDVFDNFSPLKENSIMMLSLFIFMILLLSAIGILLARISHRNAYLNGLKNGRRRKK